MDVPKLSQKVKLLKAYSRFNSSELISERVGVSRATYEGYWKKNPEAGGSIPNKNVNVWCELLREASLQSLTLEAAKDAWMGSELDFFSALTSPTGQLWGELILSARSNPIRLVKVGALSFGEPDIAEPEPDGVVRMNQRFKFTFECNASAEGFLVAEFKGEWRIISLGDGNKRIVSLRTGSVSVPPEQLALKESTSTGYYRYYFIGVEGRIAQSLRELISRVNPMTHDTLDAIANQLQFVSSEKKFVRGLLLRVDP